MPGIVLTSAQSPNKQTYSLLRPSGDYLPKRGGGLRFWPIQNIAIANIVCCEAYNRGGGNRILRNSRALSIAIMWAMQVGGSQ